MNKSFYFMSVGWVIMFILAAIGLIAPSIVGFIFMCVFQVMNIPVAVTLTWFTIKYLKELRSKKKDETNI